MSPAAVEIDTFAFPHRGRRRAVEVYCDLARYHVDEFLTDMAVEAGEVRWTMGFDSAGNRHHGFAPDIGEKVLIIVLSCFLSPKFPRFGKGNEPSVICIAPGLEEGGKVDAQAPSQLLQAVVGQCHLISFDFGNGRDR